MGKERAEKREHLFLYCTCLLGLFLLSAGCTPAWKYQKGWQGHGHLEVAEKLINKGEYEKGLKEYEEVLRLCPMVSPGDSALFHLGLLLVHPDNPQVDYKRALKYFQQLDHEFPRSALRDKTRVWRYIIAEIINSRSKIKALEDLVDGLENSLEENKRTINTFKKQLKEIKEIDIGIEEKKRKGLPDNKQVKGNGTREYPHSR